MENMIGLGKRFFQVHCARGKKLLRLRRDQIVAFFESLPRVAMETCADARGRLPMGYEVKLIPYPYVNKNDAPTARRRSVHGSPP